MVFNFKVASQMQCKDDGAITYSNISQRLQYDTVIFDWSMRWRLVVDTEVARKTADGTQYIPAFLSSVNVELFNDEDDDSEEQVDVAIDMVNRRFSEFEARGSGCKLYGID